MQNQNGYYTVDLGAEKAITPTGFGVYPCRSINASKPAEYAEWLNGLKFQDSNNGTNYTDITSELTEPLDKSHVSEGDIKWYMQMVARATFMDRCRKSINTMFAPGCIAELVLGYGGVAEPAYLIAIAGGISLMYGSPDC